MTDFQSTADSEPIASVDQLIADFHAASTPRSEWRVGTEYEKLAVDPVTGRASPFSGPRGVERVLRELAERYGWTPKEEDGRVIALSRDGVGITLEPGAQIELAGAACETIHCTRAEMGPHLEELAAVGREVGVAFLGLGIQPLSSLDEIELVPKRRYGIMAPYMAGVGSRGLRMMKQTATVQANIDFDGEADAIRKVSVGTRLAAVINAMFANSCVLEGRLARHKSVRGYIWQDTDDHRCGMLDLAFDDAAGFEHYVDWALDVPMYFILRGGEHVDSVTGTSFRDYMEHGSGGHRATMDDWRLHLTTLFPEVRLKSYIEFRSADAPPPELVLSFPALIKGIFYEADCLAGAWDLAKPFSREDCQGALDDAARGALEGRIGRHSMAEIARELCAIANEGLGRQGALDDAGENEQKYLEPLLELVEHGRTAADAVAERWKLTPTEGRMAALIDDALLRGSVSLP